ARQVHRAPSCAARRELRSGRRLVSSERDSAFSEGGIAVSSPLKRVGRLGARLLAAQITRLGGALLLAASVTAPAALAHEARPAYLEIKEAAPGQFSVLWRTPVLAGRRLPIVLGLPGDVRNLQEPTVQELTDSLVERRWIDAGPGGLAGKRIEF